MWFPVSETPGKSQSAKTGIDLTRPVDAVVNKPERIPLKWIQYNSKVFARMLADFESARPSEAICWTSGSIDVIGLGRVTRYWGCGLEYASATGAKTSPEWLLLFVNKLRDEEPEHNLILENHSHPIGSQLSRIDKDGLYALHDWNWDLYWVMTACDFQFGAYTVDDHRNFVRRVPWGVDGVWIEHEELKRKHQEKGNKTSAAETHSTMSNLPWVDKALARLKERPWPS
jgi:hypothetical protein